MTIRALTEQECVMIDNTYGYNDMIVTFRDSYNGGRELAVLDNATPDVLVGIGPNDIPNEDQVRESGMLRGGDQLLQYTNGAVILRRTIFGDQCLEGDMARTNNILPLSEEAARALAYFTQTDVDILWCSVQRRGVTTATGEAPRLVTPWDLSQKQNLLTLQTALGQIRAARNGGSDPMARELASAVSPQELGRLEAEIQARIGRLDSAGDLFMRHWVLHTLVIAFLFGVGTDIYHLAKYTLLGGRPPWEGGHRGFLLRIYDRVRGRGGNGQNPPDDGNPPPAPGGGGGTSGATASEAPPATVSQMSAIDHPDLALAQVWGALDASQAVLGPGEVFSPEMPSLEGGVGVVPAVTPVIPGQPITIPEALPFEMPAIFRPMPRFIPVRVAVPRPVFAVP